MGKESFESMLTGGHPNSLGRTLEVVDIVLSDREKLQALYKCYFSEDAIVRLRTSNAIKRVSLEKTEWLIPFIDRLINEVAAIDQASTQWTLANLFQTLRSHMTPRQTAAALKILKKNLKSHDDWIVLNNTMQTLAEWAGTDVKLQKWLVPHLQRLSTDKRKSVSGRAKKLLKVLS